ncbi:UNVERIFIED_CONTAM: hypothetical protein K2H54_057438 [Gekko kuhli]
MLGKALSSDAIPSGTALFVQCQNHHQLPLVTFFKNLQPLLLIHDSRKGQRDAQKRHKKFKSACVWHTSSSLLSGRSTPTHQSLLPKTEVQGHILSLSQEETGVKIFWLYKERQNVLLLSFASDWTLNTEMQRLLLLRNRGGMLPMLVGLFLPNRMLQEPL